MKLLKDLSISDINFKKIRSTTVGKIIDIEFETFQTDWCQICYDVDYAIYANISKTFEIFVAELDSEIINHCSKIFDMCETNITMMYRSLLKPRPNSNGCYIRIPISSTSILWGPNREYYSKEEMPNILKVGNYIRFIIKLKKLYFKDNSLTLQLDLVQAEYH